MTTYITSISFEDRCLALADELPTSASSDLVVVLDFEGYEDVGPYIFNRSRLLTALDQKGYRVIRIQSEVNAGLEVLKKMESLLYEASGTGIVLDLSTLPRKYLFGLCNLLATSGIPVSVRYYRPAEYGDDLSRGIRAVEAIPGFEGDMGPRGETILAVILGFEGYKALHAWERIGPSKVIAFLGDPPYKPEFLERAKKYNREFLENTQGVELRSLHTFDPIQAKAQLQASYDQSRSQSAEISFVVCPLGTKLQSLAAFAFAYANKSVSVAHVSSLSYFTDQYSRGYRDRIEISLQDLVPTPAR